MSEISDLLERFRRGAELVAVSITGSAGSEWDFVPQPGQWTTRQIVAHLSDAEIASTMRLRQIIAEDNPRLEAILAGRDAPGKRSDSEHASSL